MSPGPFFSIFPSRIKYDQASVTQAVRPAFGPSNLNRRTPVQNDQRCAPCTEFSPSSSRPIPNLERELETSTASISSNRARRLPTREVPVYTTPTARTVHCAVGELAPIDCVLLPTTPRDKASWVNRLLVPESRCVQCQTNSAGGAFFCRPAEGGSGLTDHCCVLWP